MTVAIKKAVIILLTLTLLATTLCGCSLLPTEEDVIAPPLVEPEVVEYKTQAVGRGDIFKNLTVSGSFVSTTQYDVGFEARSGYLSQINVANGSTVEEGQIIAQLDVQALKDNIQMQAYTIEKLELNLEAAIDGKLESEMSKDQKRAVRYAEIDLEIARITMSKYYDELEKSTIYAPVSGTVVYMTDKRVGDYVNTKETICRIADPTALYLKYTGDDIKEFNLNAEVEVTIQNEKYNGVVTVTPQTAPEEVAGSRQYILIDVPEKPEETEIGDLATVKITLDQRINVVKVSRSLISSYGSGSYYVRVLGEDGAVQERSVELGLTTSLDAEILEGLEEGDEIIVR